uniref:Uncharacterized protein n=1 Tax=Micrurus spixii TaxID=129469 RepID=A0A2D4N465_9SAUR
MDCQPNNGGFLLKIEMPESKRFHGKQLWLVLPELHHAHPPSEDAKLSPIGRRNCHSFPSSRKVTRNSRRIIDGPSQAIHLRPSRKRAGCFVDWPGHPGGAGPGPGEPVMGQRGKRCIIRVILGKDFTLP